MDIWFIVKLLIVIPLIGYVASLVILSFAAFFEYLDKKGEELIQEKYKKGEEFSPVLLNAIILYLTLFTYGFAVTCILQLLYFGDLFYYFRQIGTY